MNSLKIIILTSIIFITCIDYANAQWYAQYSSTGHFVEDIRFINRYTGWACGGNVILKTTNGGENWIQQSNSAQSGIKQIHPVNDSVVYATGWCTILKTSNGGENWIAIRNGVLPCQPILEALWFYDENIGWFCRRVQVMRTIDGCKTIIDSMRIEDDIADVHFKNFTTGVAVSYGTSFRTTNSGVNRYKVSLPIHNFSYPDARRISLIDNLGWIAGGSNVVYKTTNYGESWDSLTKIPMGPQQGLRCIEFSSTHIGYAGGDSGKMFKTIDGGNTWWHQLATQFGPGPFGSLYAYNDSVVWATGGAAGRYIIHTTNGGGLLLEVEENISEDPESYYIFQNYPNPFNPKTIISFQLAVNSYVVLKVYDVKGNKVTDLVDERKNAGRYEVIFEGTNLASGVYFYELSINKNYSYTKRMVLIK